MKDAAIALGHELASQPSAAVASMMKVLVNSSEKNLDELLIAERKAVNANNNTKDSKEGMMAFIEKRKPKFNN